MRAKKTGFLQNESGATSVEYALLASMISLAVIPAAGTLGTRLTGVFDKAAVALDAPPPTAPSGGGGGGGSQCPPNVQACGLPGQAPCGVDYYCITGCCQPIPQPK